MDSSYLLTIGGSGVRFTATARAPETTFEREAREECERLRALLAMRDAEKEYETVLRIQAERRAERAERVAADWEAARALREEVERVHDLLDKHGVPRTTSEGFPWELHDRVRLLRDDLHRPLRELYDAARGVAAQSGTVERARAVLERIEGPALHTESGAVGCGARE